MGTTAGVGVTNAALVNFDLAGKLFPQLDVYCNLTLSPVAAAALLVYVTVITFEFTSPESIDALPPKVPVNDHNHPVGAANTAVATGTVAGAEYLYFLAPHTFVWIAVIVTPVGAAGTPVTTFVNLLDFIALLPQSDVYNTLTLSPVFATVLLVKLTTIFCEFTFPESITALPPKVPTNDHTQPVAAPAVAVAAGKFGAA